MCVFIHNYPNNYPHTYKQLMFEARVVVVKPNNYPTTTRPRGNPCDGIQGLSTTAARVFLTGFLPPNKLTALDLKMLIANLRNFHVPPTTLLASEAPFADNAAWVFEVSDPTAGMAVVPMCPCGATWDRFHVV